ncbi:aldehyde-activating protein [Vibrio cionasavignyae]
MEVSCHCGNVKLTIVQKPTEITECDCSICRRYAALWGYFSPCDVTINTGAQGTTPYIWGDREVAFHHCNSCGCITHYVSTKRCSIERTAVNMRMATSEQLKGIALRKINGALY